MAGGRVARALVVFVMVLCCMALVGTGGEAVAGAASVDTGSATLASSPHGASRAVRPPASIATQPEADTATTRIAVHPNGSATWTIEIRTALTNETDRRDYRRFQAAFRNDTGRYLGTFRDRMTGLVAAAANVTGRTMAARSFTATTRIQQTAREWGIVEYRFRWDGFAATRNGTLRVGDVFESGYYLAAGDSLVVEAPAGYRIERARPSPGRRGNRTVRWIGSLDFADRRPSVRIVPAPTPDGSATTTGPGPGTRSSPGGAASTGGLLGPFVAVLGVVVLAGGAYVAVRQTGAVGSDGEAPVDGGSDAGTTADGPADDGLVTDEERVVDLLAANGGRMRQADIGDRLGWSAPKTSRVLSGMADEGTIEKLRLGNENVIDLVDDEH